MFRDTQEELERLNAELKAQEEADRQAEAEDMLDALLEDETRIGDLEDSEYKNASNDYGNYQAYNADHTDIDPAELAAQLREPEQEVPRLRGLKILALLLTLGIVGIVVFWIIYLNTGGVKW